MNTKLTLRLDDKLIASAKRHSSESGKSVSQLVSDFFALIDAKDADVEITPRVRSLRGVLAGSDLDESDYRRHLEEKHR
ncbi:MAG: antitoxin [Actinobacteria bacterium]|nr:MAG: antitoxin [Actinomycetota bacterium]